MLLNGNSMKLSDGPPSPECCCEYYSGQAIDCSTNQLMSITSIPVTAATECVLYTYNPTVLNPDGDPVTWSLITAPAGMTINPTTGQVSWTPAQGQSGSHPVTIRVSDGKNCGASSIANQSYTIVVANDDCCENDPPEITSPAETAATEGVLYEYQVTATDPESDEITYCLTVWPDGMSIDGSSGLISWTPACDQAGMHNVTVKVGDACHTCEDGTGDQEQSFVITVADDPGCV